jgi:sugar phosphate permease
MVFVVALGCVLFGLATSVWFAIAAYWLVRIGRNVIDPALTVWAVRNTAPEARATVLSMHGQSHSIGEIVAGPTVGSVGRLVSIPAALATSGVIEAVVLPLLGREALRAPPGPPVGADVHGLPVVPTPPGADPLSTEL